jgi:hypothetical protein
LHCITKEKNRGAPPHTSRFCAFAPEVSAKRKKKRGSPMPPRLLLSATNARSRTSALLLSSCRNRIIAIKQSHYSRYHEFILFVRYVYNQWESCQGYIQATCSFLRQNKNTKRESIASTESEEVMLSFPLEIGRTFRSFSQHSTFTPIRLLTSISTGRFGEPSIT